MHYILLVFNCSKMGTVGDGDGIWGTIEPLKSVRIVTLS